VRELRRGHLWAVVLVVAPTHSLFVNFGTDDFSSRDFDDGRVAGTDGTMQ
jgi:hypothetical protein